MAEELKALKRKRLVFHIGMPKCGSTYLQRLIFPNLPGVYYEKNGGRVGEGKLVDKLKLIEEIVSAAPQDTILISSEWLCGHPMNRASYAEFDEFLPHILDKYDVTVIAIVRRQDSFIDSIYRHHVNNGGVLEFDDFFSLTNDDQKVAVKIRDGSVHRSYCDYARFLAYLGDGANRSKVSLKIIPFEMMETDLPAFVQEVARTVGVTGRVESPRVFVNRGPSMPEFLIQKRLNRIVRLRGGLVNAAYRKCVVLALYIAAALAKLYYIPASQLGETERRRILEYYREGNRLVASTFEHDLCAFGYC